MVKGVKPAHCEKTTVFKSLGKSPRAQTEPEHEVGLPTGGKRNESAAFVGESLRTLSFRSVIYVWA